MGPMEPLLGLREFVERMDAPGTDTSLPGWGRGDLQNAEFVDDEAGGLSAGGDVSQGGNHLEDSMVHDCAFDDEYLSSIGDEAAYCRAAADSHSASCTDDESGGVEVGSAPFKGEGSVMYTYRESSKMRFETLNVKGSLQEATGVRQYFKR